jgi:hypothetical protein
MTWDEIAEKEGRIYCQRQDTWCALINMNDGSCSRAVCVSEDPKCITANGKASCAPMSTTRPENVQPEGTA